MILFHVSSDPDFDGKFQPQIPFERAENENKDILRTCGAPTLEQCFGSIGCCEGHYRVFKIDTEKLNISDECIILPHELCNRELVPDALFHQEHWITTEFTVPIEDQLFIEVLSWKEDFLSFDADKNTFVPYKDKSDLECGVVIFDLTYTILDKKDQQTIAV